MRLPSSPLISVEPIPGKKIAAHKTSTIAKAWSRFTARLSHEARVAGSLIFTALAVLDPAPLSAAEPPSFKAKAEHVVLVVWDGMRPDFITPELTPTLSALAKSGTFFADNHAHYITTTEVNGTVLATGVFPRQSGIVANREYRPDIDPREPVPTAHMNTVRNGDRVSAGKYLSVPTVAEIVQKAGFRTAVAGTKPIALLHDRNPIRSSAHGSAIVFEGHTFPAELFARLTAHLGKFPDYPDTAVTLEDARPNSRQNAWTTRALTKILWQSGVPKYSVLWLGDPDFSQHLTAPGSPTALAAIHDSDQNLGIMLAALDRLGVREKTDVFVVSDHGFSTVAKTVNLTAFFAAGGINTVREFKSTPQPGEVLLVNNGGSTGIHVIGKSPDLTTRLVGLLQQSEFAGPIFTRDALPGTFSLRDGRMDSADAPDIVFPFRSFAGRNQNDAPGLIFGETKRPGYGTHGTLGRTDIHNTLVAAGPDIRAGFRDEFPTGNIDVAPTILHLLGLKSPAALDGRILTEALAGVEWDAPKPAIKRLEATREIGSATWRQWIQTTTFAGGVYFDEGSAAVEK